VIDVIAAFVREIGLPLRFGTSAVDGVLPGIVLERGTIVVDRDRALPGDVLHEAGHLALLPPPARATAHGRLASAPGDEMAAMAWSYAAAVRLDIDPSVVFHAAGYRGGGNALREAYACGPAGPGVPILELRGMAEAGAYPAMRRWLNAGDPSAQPPGQSGK
jgi:hypothetical protein